MLTAQQLAEVLNVPVATIWKWARSAEVPSIRLPGGRRFVRFDLAAVEAALEGGGTGD